MKQTKFNGYDLQYTINKAMHGSSLFKSDLSWHRPSVQEKSGYIFLPNSVIQALPSPHAARLCQAGMLPRACNQTKGMLQRLAVQPES